MTLLPWVTAGPAAKPNQAPVRLALISESSGLNEAENLLTADLGRNPKIQLVERDEIERVYREQGLSAVGRNDVQLGRILGADGLLVLKLVKTSQATNLMARLIAVKPGVVLTDGRFSWALKDTPQWAESVATYLTSFLPKLTLLAKDAIPISIVNFRAAISSTAEDEMERELKLLITQRLGQEQRLFVLERERMQLLSNEKELKSDESPFWDGSYLLSGIIDQDGYFPNAVSINVLLTPPKGGAPVRFEVSGGRTNLAEVVNRLAAKLIQSLNIHSAVAEWSATKESAQYYQEAKWALRWGVYSEAEASADSAWALGKRDVECATVRVMAYALQATANRVAYETAQDSFDCFGGYDSNNRPLGPPVSRSVVEARIKQIDHAHPNGMHGKPTFVAPQNLWIFDYAFGDKPPDPKNIECALHALDLYYQYSRNSPQALLRVASAASSWTNSAWYDLGIQALVAASKVLRDFNFNPKEQNSVAGELADLRALARSVALWISQTPAVHESYYVGNQLATHDELRNTMENNPNIFRCEADWGCYWQESPEEEVALYRKLMSSPVFRYIHRGFWIRELTRPRLVAWNETDRKSLPAIWKGFIQQLSISTNVLLRMEAKALEFADAPTGPPMAVALTNLLNCILNHKTALTINNVEVLYLDWGLGDLVDSTTTRGGIDTETGDVLDHLYWSKYNPELETLDREYWNKTVPSLRFLPIFQEQIRYLKGNTPFQFFKFVKLFHENTYSQSQMREILPLLAAYKSNLVAQTRSATGMQHGKLMSAISQVASIESDVIRASHSPEPYPPPQPNVQAARSAPMAEIASTAQPATNAPEIATHVITINKFYPIPWERLLDLSNVERVVNPQVTVTAHHWFDGKLLLDFTYSAGLEWFGEKGGGNIGGNAIAIFDPGRERWSVIGCPRVGIRSQNRFYHRSALVQGALFNCDGGRIRKYDFLHQRWKVLKISDGNNYELFGVDGHLYAANENIIFEVRDGGNTTRILASTRRQPPLSALDRQNLGIPILFRGPAHSLRVVAADRIYTWTGSDWREDSAAPPAAVQPEILSNGLILFHCLDAIDGLQAGAKLPELYLQQNAPSPNRAMSFGNRSSAKATRAPQPLWKMPPGLFFSLLPASACRSGMYLLMNHSKLREITNNQDVLVQEKVLSKDGYNAVLLCFSRGLPWPQKLLLNFDAQDGCPPAAGINPKPNGFPVPPPAWMLATTNLLLMGLENPRNSIPAFNQADLIGVGYKAGIWLLPISQIESKVNSQKYIQLSRPAQEQKQARAAQEQRPKILKQQ